MPGGSGNPAVDRLGALAGRLLSVASAQVSLLTDGNSLVVAGSGLPAGMLGRELSAPDSLCTLTAQFGSPLVIDDARTDPRVRDLPRVRSGTVGCFLGVPLLDAGDRVVGALGVFDPEPRRWRDDDLDLLAELGRAVATELELTALGSDLEASQTRLDLVMQAAQVGTWSLDPATGEVVWDEASARMYAVPLHDRANSMTDVADRVHPADQDGLTRAIEGALADRGVLEHEFRVVWPDGSVHWLLARGRVVDAPGAGTRLVGANLDVTESRSAAQQREAAGRRVAVLGLSALRLSAVQSEQAVLDSANAHGFGLLGVRGAALTVSDGPDRRRLFSVGLRADRAQETELPRGDQPLFAVALGAGRQVFGDRAELVRHFPDAGEAMARYGLEALVVLPMTVSGRLLGAVATFWDEPRTFTPDDLSFLDAMAAQCAQACARVQSVRDRDAALRTAQQERTDAETARAAAERQRAEAEAARGRADLLARSAELLVAGLDLDAVLAAAADVLVPALATGISVHLVDAAGRARLGLVRHADPGLEPDLRLLGETYPVVPAGPGRAGRIVLTDAGAPAAGPADPVPAPVRAALTRLRPSSAISVPLSARGRVLGSIGLLGTAGAYSAEDLNLAEQIADRVALALDNAYLFVEQRETALALQQALLSAPPQPAGLRIATRYQPAAEQAQVGGDWYDAFVQPDGATVLVIGDVVGHDRIAAAAMGQIRWLLRGVGFAARGRPADLLTRTDEAMAGLAVDTTATAVVARLETAGPDGGRRLLWSNAGHLPPVLLGPDGRAELLEDDEAALFLGLDPESERRDSSRQLSPGSTLLLYTDGLVERRGESLDVGLRRLTEVVADLAGCSPDELCDRLLARMLTGGSEDDVALVAVRL